MELNVSVAPRTGIIILHWDFGSSWVRRNFIFSNHVKQNPYIWVEFKSQLIEQLHKISINVNEMLTVQNISKTQSRLFFGRLNDYIQSYEK